jgi:hypothetical protein
MNNELDYGSRGKRLDLEINGVLLAQIGAPKEGKPSHEWEHQKGTTGI